MSRQYHRPGLNMHGLHSSNSLAVVCSSAALVKQTGYSEYISTVWLQRPLRFLPVRRLCSRLVSFCQ